MGSEVKEKQLTFDVQGEFITQWTREAFYSGEKSFEKIMETLILCMVNEDVPEAQTRRYAEDILLGRAALKGSTAAGTYHLEIYEPGEEEQMPQSMNIWKETERRKKAEKNLQRMVERWDVAMSYIPEETKRAIRKELGEETTEDKQRDALDSFMHRMMDEKDHTTTKRDRAGRTGGSSDSSQRDPFYDAGCNHTEVFGTQSRSSGTDPERKICFRRVRRRKRLQRRKRDGKYLEDLQRKR